ncbi:MAG: response regulator [Bacteroidota bacterium]|jgi:ActR/RegA family two-component response regulator
METLDNLSAFLAADNTMLSGIKSSTPAHSNVSLKRAGTLSKKTQKKITLFIIDDDIMYIKALEHSIANKINSLAIYLFQTGEECLQQMKLKPAIVILDYYLNTKVADAQNGIAVLKQIRKISSKTKVIMLSGQDSLQVANDCMANGAYDYISKSDTSFVRINNLIANIVGDIEINASYKTFRYTVLIVILMLIAYGLIS